MDKKTNQELIEWTNYKVNDSFYQNDLKKNQEKLIKRLSSFFHFNNDGVITKQGFGKQRINEITIQVVTKAWLNLINNDSFKELKILIAFDDRNINLEYAKKIFDLLKNEYHSPFIIQDLQPLSTNLVSFIIKNKKLDGAIYLGSNLSSGKYNGIKIFNSLGQQNSLEEYRLIKNRLDEIDINKLLNSNQNKHNLNFISNSIISDYEDQIIAMGVRKNDQQLLKIGVYNYPTHSKTVSNILSKLNYEHYLIDFSPNLFDLNQIKEYSPEDKFAYKSMIKSVFKNKLDLGIFIDKLSEKINFVIKNKQEVKILNCQEIVLLYIDYLWKNKLEDLNIYYPIYLNESINKLSTLHNYKSYSYTNYLKVISTNKNKNSLVFDIDYRFLLNNNITSSSDAMQMMMMFVEMFNYYKTQTYTIDYKLSLIYKQIGNYNYKEIELELKDKLQNDLLDKIIKNKKNRELSINSIDDFRQNNLNAVKVNLTENNCFSIVCYPVSNSAKILIQLFKLKQKNQLIKTLRYENEIFNFIEDNKPQEILNKPKTKTIVKYSFLSLIFVSLIVLIFLKIYASGNVRENWGFAKYIFIENVSKNQWLLIAIWAFILPFFDGLIKKRILHINEVKVSIYHCYIASLMGIIMSWITPLMIGGDIVVYWYLKRKNVKRSALLSMATISLILFQISLILPSIVYLTFFSHLYYDAFFNEQIKNIFFLSFALSFGFAILIFMMVFIQPIQFQILNFYFWIKNYVWYDYQKDSNQQIEIAKYELNQIKKSIVFLIKNPLLFLELSFYAVLPLFFDPLYIVIQNNNLINDKKNWSWLEKYVVQLIGRDISFTSNALSPTPGGLGTLELFGIWARANIYKYNNYSPLETATGFDLIHKLYIDLPRLIASILLCINIVVIEIRQQYLKKIRKNMITKNKNVNPKLYQTNIYYYSIAFWIVIAIIFISLIYFAF